MLRKLNKDEYMQYLDSAYELALDMSRSCYPTYADGLKTQRGGLLPLCGRLHGDLRRGLRGRPLQRRGLPYPMVRALNQSKKDGMKDMTFFHEDETHPAVESVGIRTIDTYYGHKLTL